MIVETDDVAAKLLKRGNLQYRATFLPLNKMNARTISDHQLRAAHSLVSNKNQVQRAIDLIEYDNRLQVLRSQSHFLPLPYSIYVKFV